MHVNRNARRVAKMERIAFAIPLDIGRHRAYANNLAALSTSISDIYIILTNQSDLEIWKKDPVAEVHVLVLSDWIPDEAIEISLKNRSIVTFKKWMALRRLSQMHNYRYIITCDSEIAVIKPINQQFINNLESQFILVGDHRRITWLGDFDAVARRFDPPTSIESGPCDDEIFCWWSGMPVYDSTSLPGFLQYIQADDPIKLAKSIDIKTFDHLVYQRYIRRLGLHGARYVCLTHDMLLPPLKGWSLEFLPSSQEVHDAARRAGLKTLWVHHKFSSFGPDAYIIYHLDRQDLPYIN